MAAGAERVEPGDCRRAAGARSGRTSAKGRPAPLRPRLFPGAPGIRRFHIGKAGTGVPMPLTAGGLGAWRLVDRILIPAASDYRESEGGRVVR